MARLSVNVNKVATIRNSRGGRIENSAKRSKSHHPAVGGSFPQG